MDFFQGRAPPNFIPVCLDKQNTGNAKTPEPGLTTTSTQDEVCSPPLFLPPTPFSRQVNVPGLKQNAEGLTTENKR